MTDYRRIDPDGLVVQARALGDLAAELAVTARRIDGTLAPVGGGVSTMPIVETARWLDGWASTMTSKAAIAAEAMSPPAAAPVLLASGSSPTSAGGSTAVLRTVTVPRWVERPLLAVQDVARTVTRAAAGTVFVQELRTTTERVLERVPVTVTVTDYVERLKTFTEWRDVRVPVWVQRQRQVTTTEYRWVARTVTSVVPVYHTVTNLIWNGWRYIQQSMRIVEHRQVSRTEYSSVPVQVTRPVTESVQQWVTQRLPITVSRVVLEPVTRTAQTWVERWVTRPVQSIVTTTKRVVDQVTKTVTTPQAAVGRGGEWVYETRQVMVEVPREESEALFASRSGDDLPESKGPPRPGPERLPDWATPIALSDARELAAALGVEISNDDLLALVMKVNGQAAPIYSAGDAMTSPERLVAVLEALKIETPQARLAATALADGSHPAPLLEAIEKAIDDYVHDPYNQISLIQAGLTAAAMALGGSPHAAVVVGLLATSMKTSVLQQKAADGELTLCEARFANRMQVIQAFPALGVEGKIAVAIAKSLAKRVGCD